MTSCFAFGALPGPAARVPSRRWPSFMGCPGRARILPDGGDCATIAKPLAQFLSARFTTARDRLAASAWQSAETLDLSNVAQTMHLDCADRRN